MKFLALALSATVSTALAAVIPQEPLGPSIVQNTQQPKWLIELAPYTTRWVTEEEKWALKLVGRSIQHLPPLLIICFRCTGWSKLHRCD